MNSTTTADSSDAPLVPDYSRVPSLAGRARDRTEDALDRGLVFCEVLAEWAEGELDTHAVVGSEHYSWDVPGFSEQSDIPGGSMRTLKTNGRESLFVEVGTRERRSDLPREDRAALLAAAERYGMVVRRYGSGYVVVPFESSLDA